MVVNLSANLWVTKEDVSQWVILMQIKGLLYFVFVMTYMDNLHKNIGVILNYIL